ncbi:MAG: type IV secretion protein IcmD [Pseudomonadota bacterium]|nr:type IV secretion protein IcmD [Gammaproteobacteria bacterium]MBU1926872.1 type IV secretion protein IcmD [Gammaproteobacteria bacterium]MBU2546131.1 type IV secretion protein IcmD [Gammaproteobacteria bacterium]
MKHSLFSRIQSLFLSILAFCCFYIPCAFAADDLTLGSIAGNVQSSFAEIAKLITAGSFIAGLGLAIMAIMKFKAHKDDARTTPLGTPIILLFVATGMLFLPTVFKSAGVTIFGTTPTETTISGITSI